MLSKSRTIIVTLLMTISLPVLAQELRATRNVEIKESPPSKYILKSGDTLGVVRQDDVVTLLEKKIIRTPVNEYIWLQIQYRNTRSDSTLTGWVYAGKEGEQQFFQPVE